MSKSTHHSRFKELSKPLEPQKTDTTPVLKKLSDIRVIAYDFYGTLFISEAGDIGVDDGKSDPEIMKDVFEAARITTLRDDAHREAYTTYNQVVNNYLEEHTDESNTHPEPDIEKVWQQVLLALNQRKLIKYETNQMKETATNLAIEFEARMNPVWPMPGAVETLEWFRERGILQGIISNSQFYTPVILEALTGKTMFDLGLSSSLLHWSFEEKRKKPDVTFYKGFLEKVLQTEPDLSPGQVLYVGNDMLKDIWPAYTVGMKTALFAGDRRSLKYRKEDDRCKDLSPDLVLTSLEQLKECVET